MKKILSLIAILLLSISCSNDVKFNNPGFQVYKNGSLFTGVDVKAYQDTSGKITIVALADNETINLDLASSNIGTYYLGTANTSNLANYTSLLNGYNLEYQTDVISGPVAKIETPMISGGLGYTSTSQPSGTAYVTGTGPGTGLTVIVKQTNGIVSGVTIASPGNGYRAGDILKINGGSGTGGTAKFRILNVQGSNGEVIITDNTGGTLTGTFKFNAPKISTSSTGDDHVNFYNGAFYKIPIVPAP